MLHVNITPEIFLSIIRLGIKLRGVTFHSACVWHLATEVHISAWNLILILLKSTMALAVVQLVLNILVYGMYNAEVHLTAVCSFQGCYCVTVQFFDAARIFEEIV
jgi:hypothetical protein